MKLPNFGYHFARWKGRTSRSIYRAAMPQIIKRPVKAPRPLDLSVFSYSNEQMLPEQVRSIRSFLRHVGRPKSFTVVSDGSHSEESIRFLRDVDSNVSVQLAGARLAADLPEKFRHYVTMYPMAKQLGLLMTLPANGPSLYVDADVLFFNGAADFIHYLSQTNAPAFYLPDCQTSSADPRVLRTAPEELHPVNCGFLLFLKPLDWSIAIERFMELGGEPNFFTNQTLAHLALHANGARPFDPAKYIVQLDDQFVYQDRHAGPTVALRHYVNPVRHKFWGRFFD
ncbi:MAG: hypothetical protein ABR514_11905 [Chthoniobacterales bacterium]